MKFGPVPTNKAEGAVLAHSVSGGGRIWRKAHVLSADDVAQLQEAGIAELIVARLDKNDVGEDDAAKLLAESLDGENIVVRAPSTGRVNLHAKEAGVFRAFKAEVDAINAIDPAITLATLPDYAAVEEGQMVATVKIIPFAVDRGLLEKAVAVARRSSVLALHPFAEQRIGLVQTVLPSVKQSVLDKTRRLTEARLARSGSVVVDELRTPHEASAVSEAIVALSGAADMVVVFGASAVCDEEDVIPAAIKGAGGEVLRVGMPVDPGNLLVVGRLGAVPVIGAPGCARSPKLNGFDWVLDRLLAGLDVSASDIAGMGVGGLLMEIESRPQPRDPKPAKRPLIDVILLAAGRGQRMGGPNKLLAVFDGRPLVRHVADVLAAAPLRELRVVTGHQAERIRDALDGSDVRFVHNPDFGTGLASSLKAGIASLPADSDGVLVALADMPRVGTAEITRMAEAFTRAGGRSIVRATHGGKRGNPVIIPRALYAAVSTLEGDTGARHLIEASELPVVEVEIGEAASLDVDTPEAMERAGGVLVK